jgi:hypothetical protein
MTDWWIMERTTNPSENNLIDKGLSIVVARRTMVWITPEGFKEK